MFSVAKRRKLFLLMKPLIQQIHYRYPLLIFSKFCRKGVSAVIVSDGAKRPYALAPKEVVPASRELYALGLHVLTPRKHSTCARRPYVLALRRKVYRHKRWFMYRCQRKMCQHQECYLYWSQEGAPAPRGMLVPRVTYQKPPKDGVGFAWKNYSVSPPLLLLPWLQSAITFFLLGHHRV